MPFKQLKKFSVTQKAMPFFREYLGYGKTFSKLLLENHDLKQGDISIYFPPEVVLHDDFRYSVLYPLKNKLSYDVDIFGVEFVQQFLSQGKNKICIFEDANAEPTDPYLQRRPDLPWLGFKNEVYHILDSNRNDKKLVNEVIRYAQSWLTIGALTSFPGGFEFQFSTHKIEENVLKILAQNTVSIILGAYDGEGYLIWEKTK